MRRASVRNSFSRCCTSKAKMRPPHRDLADPVKRCRRQASGPRRYPRRTNRNMGWLEQELCGIYTFAHTPETVSPVHFVDVQLFRQGSCQTPAADGVAAVCRLLMVEYPIWWSDKMKICVATDAHSSTCSNLLSARGSWGCLSPLAWGGWSEGW